jgi:hypothetical protein
MSDLRPADPVQIVESHENIPRARPRRYRIAHTVDVKVDETV